MRNLLIKWWLGGESNPRPRGYESCTRPQGRTHFRFFPGNCGSPANAVTVCEPFRGPLMGSDGTKRAHWIRGAAAVALAAMAAACSQPDPSICDKDSPQYLECKDAQQALQPTPDK